MLQEKVYSTPLWRIFSIVFFLVLCGSAGGIFRFNPFLSNLLVLTGLFLLWFFKSSFFCVTLNTLFCSLLYAIAFTSSYGRYSNWKGAINVFVFILIIFLLFALKNEAKTKLLDISTKYLAILLGISCIAWAADTLGICSIPSFQYIPNEEQVGNGSLYVFKHHYLFLVFDYAYLNMNIMPRFQAIFIEPGYLGTICLLFTAANNFNFKKWPVAVLFCLMLISCSLAAYIIFTFGFLLHLFLKKKYMLLFCCITAVLIFAAVSLFLLPEDNLVYHYIWRRLFAEDGIEYNRSTPEFSHFFWNQFCRSGELLWGSEYGIQLSKDTRSVDFKMFLVYYGVFGALLSLLFYLVCFLKNRNPKVICLCAVFGMIFLQSSWVCQYLIYIAPFILALTPQEQFYAGTEGITKDMRHMEEMRV